MQHKNYSNTVEMGAGTSMISTQGFATLKSNIQASINSLLPYQSDNDAKSLSTAYNTLLISVNTTITDISGASANTIAAQQSGLNTQMDDLDKEKEEFFRKIKGITYGDILRIISQSVGMLFAAIILTNMMVRENWKYKLLYAFWGAVFYPIVLLYGVYNPPTWHALLFPIFESSTKEWYMRYLNYFALFVYNNPNNVTGVKNISTMTLRVFILLVIIFWCVSHWGIT